MIYKSESGRSMLELLAVLAVIGVLSVGGVEGYTYAMDKNEANNVAEEVAILAHEVSQQMNRGQAEGSFTDQVKSVDLPQDVQIKLKKYNSNTKKYEEGEPASEDEQFALEVSGLKPKVGKIFLSSVLGSEPGLQKVQKNEGGEIQDLTNLGDWDGSSSNTSSTTKLALVYQKDLEDTCAAGEYKVDGLCQLATGRNITSGDGVLEECPNATEPNSGHTECVACTAGEQCGCAKMSDGNGNCVDCVKNATCGTDKMCYSGQCYACPANADCTIEQGFKCKNGYNKDGVYCCPDHATCTTDKNGNMEVTCTLGYTGTNCDECDSAQHVEADKKNGGCKCVAGYHKDSSGACINTCSDYTSTECGTGYFCLFTTNVTSTSSGTGTCQAVGQHATNTSYYGTSHELWKSTTAGPSSNGTMNWWSAKSWCLAQGKDLLDISGTTLGCYPKSGMTEPLKIVNNAEQSVGYCCNLSNAGTCSSTKTLQSEKMQVLRDESLGASGNLWTDTLHAPSIAYIVALKDGEVHKGVRSLPNRYALCE